MFSIIVPAYNSSSTLERCIQSVISQNCQEHYEIIIINDGSSDNTLQIANELQSRYPEMIRVYSKHNGGVSSARNIGLLNATQSIICFLDSDEFWEENYLSYLNEIYSQKKYDYVGVCKYNVNPTVGLEPSLFKLALKWFPHISGLSYVRDRFETLRFDETLSHAEDGLFLISITAKGRGYWSDKIFVKDIFDKRSWGVSGLSSDIESMFRGELKSWRIADINGARKYIKYIAYLFIRLKYLRRVLLKYIHN